MDDYVDQTVKDQNLRDLVTQEDTPVKVVVDKLLTEVETPLKDLMQRIHK